MVLCLEIRYSLCVGAVGSSLCAGIFCAGGGVGNSFMPNIYCVKYVLYYYCMHFVVYLVVKRITTTGVSDKKPGCN